jgi:hypothetical protein
MSTTPAIGTPDIDLDDMIFVFGSNELGRHGGGAAKAAMSHGARYGQGFGLQGKSFAIPTCAKPTNEPDSTITPDMLRYYIYTFILFAKMNPQLTFQVTRVGCGLAGWADGVVAPLFTEAPANCQFDGAWEPLLPGRKYWGSFGGMVIQSPAFQAATDVVKGSVTIDAEADKVGTVKQLIG